jgi:hypothetical protein
MTARQIRDIEISMDIEKTNNLYSIIAYWEDKISGDTQEFENLIMNTYQSGANDMKETIIQKIK